MFNRFRCPTLSELRALMTSLTLAAFTIVAASHHLVGTYGSHWS